MSVFKNIAENLKRIDLNAICKQVTEQISEEITVMNTDNQLYERGVDNEGKSLGKYSPAYEKIKKRKGQRTDHVTTRDTGKYHSLFKVKTKKEEAEVYSSDPKSIWLIQRYGRNIQGLTDDNLQILIDMFYRKAIINTIRNAITQR